MHASSEVVGVFLALPAQISTVKMCSYSCKHGEGFFEAWYDDADGDAADDGDYDNFNTDVDARLSVRLS